MLTHEPDGMVKRGHVVLLNAVVMEGAGRLMAKWKVEEEHIAEKYGGKESPRSAPHHRREVTILVTLCLRETDNESFP